MKLAFILLLIPSLCFSQSLKNYIADNEKVQIKTSAGTLNIFPLNDKAVRVQLNGEKPLDKPELIINSKITVPEFKTIETEGSINIQLKNITVIFDKTDETLRYINDKGIVFLKETASSRKLISDSIMGQSCYIAVQSFESPVDEALFGLGQFQDGYFNLKNVSRKLLQVNTQISIPFIVSSKGYGLLWHQYGLTEYNPADNEVQLTKQQDTVQKSDYILEVPTINGSEKVSQQQAYHRGKFIIKKGGVYGIMLDLGEMDKQHFVSIDGEPVIDQKNYWLPPATSTQVYLAEGEHTVEIICKWSCLPKFTFKAIENQTTFRSPNAKNLDYIVIYGQTTDEIISNYRNLSGNVPMLPLWAYGYWQSRERYTSGKMLVKTVKDFRTRNIPLDVIVQDWQYWGKHGWGVPKFDETKFQNPAGFIKEIHNLNAHISILVWENMDKFSEIGKTHQSNNFYINESSWLDMFNPSVQKAHWDFINKNLYSKGVDSWWLDATEPENDALHNKITSAGLGDFYRLTYPLFVSKAFYEGQRNSNNMKRVCLLSRSAFAGQQRYGTICWSGNIKSSWDDFKKQIVAGLNFSLTGMPYWTTDIGGFFRPGLPQFNPGKSQYTDLGYQELLIRWFQWGCFTPILRVHGYESETEPWNYGKTVENIIKQMLNLRYRLIPYIYSEAWQVSSNGSTLMRPLLMDFQDDYTSVNHKYQYMFGKAFLVAPVLSPKADQWEVHLPKGTKWYDFWTGKKFEGGTNVVAKTPLSRIPVYVKAGSVVPLGKFIQFTGQKNADTLEIRVYTGQNGDFILYEDEGDNYNYEKNEYSTISFQWEDDKNTLIINDAAGQFKGMLKKRIFNIVWVDELSGNGINPAKISQSVKYEGKKIVVRKN